MLQSVSEWQRNSENLSAKKTPIFDFRNRKVIYQVNKPFHPSTSSIILVKISPLDFEIPGLESRSLKN